MGVCLDCRVYLLIGQMVGRTNVSQVGISSSAPQSIVMIRGPWWTSSKGRGTIPKKYPRLPLFHKIGTYYELLRTTNGEEKFGMACVICPNLLLLPTNAIMQMNEIACGTPHACWNQHHDPNGRVGCTHRVILNGSCTFQGIVSLPIEMHFQLGSNRLMWFFVTKV